MKHKVEQNIPKKKSGSELHVKAMTNFFQSCFDALISIDYTEVKCVIIASPGFVKDEFFKFIQDQMLKPDLVAFNKKTNFIQKIVRAKSSTGYLSGLNEVLSDPTIQAQLKETKAIKEILVLEDFYKVNKKNIYF